MSKQITWENGVRVIKQNHPLTQQDIEKSVKRSREQMQCSPLQGKLALGQDRWMIIEDYLSNYATWEQKQIVANASVWKRNSPSIAIFKDILQLTDKDLDKLFKQAAKIEV